MSHVTPIERAEGWDIPVLKDMCKTNDWQFLDQETFRWYGQYVGDYPMPEGYTVDDLGKCDHAIRIPGCSYDIGVVNKNGKTELIWDFYEDGGLQRVLGQDAGLLKRDYDFSKAKLAARQKGHSFQESPTGRVGWKKAVIKLGGW